jgi:hypothetical protein
VISSGRLFPRRILLPLCLVAVAWPAFAQPPTISSRESFVRELTSALLGTNGEPLKLDGNEGWRGVVLAPPGTALSPTVTAFDVYGYDSVSVAKVLEAISQFDSVLAVHDGIGYPGPLSVANAWERVLEQARPVASQRELELEQSPVGTWLFRSPDKVDELRGVTYIREPSVYMLNYREYQNAFRMLVASEQRQDGTWRFNPKLMPYSSIQEAKEAVSRDWSLYGYQSEIEQALAAFAEATHAAAWREWSEAKEAFTENRIELTPYRWASVTLLFPPPSEWLNMSSWRQGVATLPIPSRRVRFQFARVRILRPWFLVEKLLTGRLQLRESQTVLSDGTSPTSLKYPSGELAVFPEELVLVRGIHFVQGDENNEQPAPPTTQHTLGGFYYADAINLLGYVVRVLPKLPENKR